MARMSPLKYALAALAAFLMGMSVVYALSFTDAAAVAAVTWLLTLVAVIAFAGLALAATLRRRKVASS